NTVGAAIPPEYLDESVTGQFYSDHYSRLIVNTNLGVEGERAFSFIDEIYETVDIFYPEGYHALGESITLYDMRNVVQEDNTFVNVMTIVTIGLALLIAFKSLSFPIVLLLAIQAAVWINLAIPYFTESPLVFVGYLIVSTV